MEAALDTAMKDIDKEVDSLQPDSNVKSGREETEERMLLSKPSGQLFAQYLEVPELAVEVERAVWQVEKSLKAQQERKEEVAELESATSKQPESNR